ncbi:MAG: M48 family metallopeptidase, partial [Fibrobacter sp.]|nr:M48 family metallopeptidase [Fibrobacter sp.]
MKWFVVALLIIHFIFESFLLMLNKKHSKKAIPRELRGVYDSERYARWQAYFSESQNFSLLHKGYNLFVLLMLLIGTFPFLEVKVASWTAKPILQTLYFLGIYYSIIFVLNIPLEIYKTFSLEARHGFNRRTLKTFIKDSLMNYLLNLVLGAIIIALANSLYLRFADSLWLFGLLASILVSLVMLLAFAYLNPLFLRMFNKFTPLEEGSLNRRIEGLASSDGFNLRSISIMDASRRSNKLNAFFTGIGKNKEVVLFDTLLEKMDDDQVMAVLAHELGHAANKDTWRLFGQQILLVFFSFLALGLILANKGVFLAFGLSGINFAFALVLVLLIGKPLWFFLMQATANNISRQLEY